MAEALVLLAAAALSAAETSPRIVTLEEAVARAAVANSTVLSAAERAREARAAADGAARSLLPGVFASTRWSVTDAPAMVFMSRLSGSAVRAEDFAPAALNEPSVRSHLTTRIGVQAPLDAFGRAARLRDAADAVAEGATLDAAETRAQLRYEVASAWTGAAVAREMVRVLDAASAAAAAREAEAEARASEGILLGADLLRLRARRREREADRARGIAALAQSEARLAILLGATPGERFTPSDLPEPPAPPPDAPAVGNDPLIATALARAPWVQAARRRVEAARLSDEAERRSALPEIAAAADLSDDRSTFSAGRRSWSVGAVARVSLFDPARATRRAETRARLRFAEIQLEAAEREVRLAIPAARRRLEASFAAYRAAIGGTEEAREALRVVRERRSAGLATLTDELETEAAALGAALLELGARAESLVAWESLSRAAGGLQR